MDNDAYDLGRFVRAQQGDYDRALAEITAGAKRSHWMWYVFPQIAGLGHSSTARHYALRGAGEARAYLAHPLLGPCLQGCAEAVLSHAGQRSANAIFGYPDDLKLRSSATLFAHVSPPDSVFHRLLAGFYPDGPDPETLRLLATDEPGTPG